MNFYNLATICKDHEQIFRTDNFSLHFLHYFPIENEMIDCPLDPRKCDRQTSYKGTQWHQPTYAGQPGSAL